MKKGTLVMVAASAFMLGFYVGGWRKAYPLIDAITVGLYILVNLLWYASALREMKQLENDFRKYTKELLGKRNNG